MIVSCATNSQTKVQKLEILASSKVKFEKLNPARGEKSPQAGTLWGDRKGTSETAFLAKFVDGFSSPPHIHNVSYRGIVISGLVHNDDPKAAKMWMPKVSYWTQPAGESHITAAKGQENIAFIEIDRGPYLVKPPQKAFDNGEKPFNIHASNILWQKNGSIEMAPLWKNSKNEITGNLIKFKGDLKISGKFLRIVPIDGKVKVLTEEKALLGPGSLITVKNSILPVKCLKEMTCILYLKSDPDFKFL